MRPNPLFSRINLAVPFLSGLGCGLVLMTPRSTAQTSATTLPVGAYTIKVPGKAEGETQRRTYFGVQLLPERTFAGTVSAVSGNEVTIANWNSASLGMTAGHQSCLHVLSGTGRGFVAEIEESLATGVRCPENMAAWV